MNKKNLIALLTIILVMVLMSACESSSNQNDEVGNDNADKNVNEEDNTDDEDSDENNGEMEVENTSNKNDNGNSEVSGENENINSDDGGNTILSENSSEEIEYARVWLQFGDIKDIDELNIKQILSGEPMNPDDETSINYPENVIQLTTSRLAEGSITYSSNGDGTIKLYKKVPQRWDGKNPAGEDVYKEIIEDTEQKFIEPGNDEKIQQLIKKINTDI